MTLRPIDMKTAILTNNDASRIREEAKNQEAGQAINVSQNVEKGQEKFEAVQNTQASEHKHIRNQDEAAEKEKGNPDHPPKKPNKEGDPDEEPAKSAQLSDGVRGSLVDVKA